jgi:hypothetical protein
MKSFLNVFWISAVCVTLFSCDNEVVLSADYEDTTVVYGLINANADTQFIKVNRAFLDGNTNALSLAQDPERLYYNNLDVQIRNLSNNQLFPLDTISKPKEEGLFTNERNILYFTDTSLQANTNYRIEVRQPDGKLTYADAIALDTVSVVRPNIGRRQQLSFTTSNGSILDYNFQFRHSASVAEFEVTLFVHYTERLANGNEVPRSIPISVGKVVNDRLIAQAQAEIELPGRRFFETIANSIDPNNTNAKILENENPVSIEIFAADSEYTFYASIFGPIDGLAQVRPEYTNVENGIGLFASRSRSLARTTLAAETNNQIRNGPITGNLGFQLRAGNP